MKNNSTEEYIHCKKKTCGVEFVLNVRINGWAKVTDNATLRTALHLVGKRCHPVCAETQRGQKVLEATPVMLFITRHRSHELHTVLNSATIGVHVL